MCYLKYITVNYMDNKKTVAQKMAPVTIVKEDVKTKVKGDFYEFHKGLVEQIQQMSKSTKNPKTGLSCCVEGCCVSWCCVQVSVK
jgi:ribosome maturation protein Sdo1